MFHAGYLSLDPGGRNRAIGGKITPNEPLVQKCLPPPSRRLPLPYSPNRVGEVFSEVRLV